MKTLCVLEFVVSWDAITTSRVRFVLWSLIPLCRQPEFCSWGFNLPRGDPCLEKWQKIPSNVDILMTHGPPIGHGDLCTGGNRAGCVDLLREVQYRIRPKYHVFGHIHEG